MGQLDGNVHVEKTLSAGSWAVGPAAVGNTQVISDPSAPIEAEKVECCHVETYSQENGTDVVAKTVELFIVHGVTGELVSIEITSPVVPAGGDQEVSVDVKKATEASPTPSTVLSAPIEITASEANYEIKAGVISGPALVDGSVVSVVVTVSGSTGTQAQGLCVTIRWNELPA